MYDQSYSADPGKQYLLELAAAATRDAVQQRYRDGLSFAIKEMIGTEMMLNTIGPWEECELSPKLQNII